MTYSILMLACALAASAPADEAARTVKELQGTWTLVEMEEKGEKATAEDLKKEGVSFVIKGNELLLKEHAVTKMRFSFTLDPAQSPKHIDFQRSDKTVQGACHGIYSLKAEELKLCVGTNFNPDEPENRPQRFATTQGSKARPMKRKLLFILKRNKE